MIELIENSIAYETRVAMLDEQAPNPENNLVQMKDPQQENTEVAAEVATAVPIDIGSESTAPIVIIIADDENSLDWAFSQDGIAAAQFDPKAWRCGSDVRAP